MFRAYVFLLSLMTCISACGGNTTGNNKTISDVDMDTPIVDMSSTDMAKVVEKDMADMQIKLDMSIEGKPCSKTSDCIRGYSCSRTRSVCTNQSFGCVALRDDEGCVYDSGAGKTSPKECSSDEECKDSKYGTNCVQNICANYTECRQDSDCPSNVCGD